MSEVNGKLRILLIEDSATDAELLQRALAKEGLAFSLERVESEQEFVRALSSSQPDVILSDYQLPAFTAMAALSVRHSRAPLIPFIVVTGSLNEETAVSCIKAGADDYIIKQHLNRLGSAIKSALERKRALADRKVAEARLRDSEEQLRLILENAVDLIALVDLSGRLLFVSPSYQRVFGAGAAIGSCWLDQVHEEDRGVASRVFESAVDVRSGARAEYRILDGDGQERCMESHLSSIRAPDGSPQKVVVVSRDITERKEAEASLIEKTRQLELLNEEGKHFAFVASHHLREPLRKVLVFTDRLESRRESLEAADKDCVERIRATALHLQALVHGLVQYACVTQTQVEFERVDLAAAIGEAVIELGPAIRRAGGTVELGELSAVEGSPLQLKLLFSCLISNSLKFARPGVPPQIVIGGSAASEGQGFQVSVTDNGIGFDEKHLDRIFWPFQQLHARREYDGTGIGLSICQKIVQLHGGSLDARSRPGEGSTFVVTLPQRDRGARQSEAVRGPTNRARWGRVQLPEYRDEGVAVVTSVPRQVRERN